MRACRIFNGGQWAQTGRVPCSLPFAKGELSPKGSIAVEGQPEALAFRTLETWPDGSVKRALCDIKETVAAYAEIVRTYEAVDVPAQELKPYVLPAGLKVEVILDGVAHEFLSWRVLYHDVRNHRMEFVGELRAGGLNHRYYSTVIANQGFGRSTYIVGNDELQRTEATAVPIGDLRIRFTNHYGGPVFPWIHNVRTIAPAAEYRLLQNTSIGDGARWGTSFTWALTSSDLLSAYASNIYPLVGWPEPDTEDETRAYGLYGRIKGGVFPPGTGIGDHTTRAHWEMWSAWWLQNTDNTPWGRNGYWLKQEGSTGGHPDWGPATCGRDDKAMDPRGLHRWLALSLTRLRTPDHYGTDDLRFWNFPNTGAFNGWVNSPLREGGDYAQHLQGSNGWSGTDDAHREVGVQLRVFQLTGEEWLRREILHNGHLACLRAKVGGSYGEGRDMSRTLLRKVAAYLVAEGLERTNFGTHLAAWASSFVNMIPTLPGSTPPIKSLSIQMPGTAKHSPGTLIGLGIPPTQPYSIYPYVGPFSIGALKVAEEMTGSPAFGQAADLLLPELVTLIQSDGRLHEILAANGQMGTPIYQGDGTVVPGAPRLNSWVYPSLRKMAGRDPKIDLSLAAHEAAMTNVQNWDEQNWLQA